jgi:hypothetical protein
MSPYIKSINLVIYLVVEKSIKDSIFLILINEHKIIRFGISDVAKPKPIKLLGQINLKTIW